MSILPIYPGTPPPAPLQIQSPNRTAERSGLEVEGSAFRNVLARLPAPEKVIFSRHASKRLDMRGIMFPPDGIERISDAIDRAASKGSRDSLILAGELSLVRLAPGRGA